jgi:hypothetical protein
VITFDEHSSGAGESRVIAHFGFRLVSSGDIDSAVGEAEVRRSFSQVSSSRTGTVEKTATLSPRRL